jgi:hypothetical protein
MNRNDELFPTPRELLLIADTSCWGLERLCRNLGCSADEESSWIQIVRLGVNFSTIQLSKWYEWLRFVNNRAFRRPMSEEDRQLVRTAHPKGEDACLAHAQVRDWPQEFVAVNLEIPIDLLVELDFEDWHQQTWHDRLDEVEGRPDLLTLSAAYRLHTADMIDNSALRYIENLVWSISGPAEWRQRVRQRQFSELGKGDQP